MIYKFLALLVVHWFADFVLQTHWQASNKSKSNVALLQHVMVYIFVLMIGVDILFVGMPWLQWGVFAVTNFALHFATDWCTSRITSKLFMSQFDVGMRSITMKEDFNPHNFFVVIGLDQLIHQVTLALTMIYFFGGV